MGVGEAPGLAAEELELAIVERKDVVHGALSVR
jgi:hypothetical protein